MVWEEQKRSLVGGQYSCHQLDKETSPIMYQITKAFRQAFTDFGFI